jgi:tetratricopeptide (TPR) repeat protein
MQIAVTIVLALVAALAGRWLGSELRTAAAPAESAVLPELGALRLSLDAARSQLAELAAELERTAPGASPAANAPAGPSDEELAAALARWREAHPAAEEARTAARRATTPRAPGDPDLATMPMAEIARELAKSGFGDNERQALFQKLRELGRIDEYLAEIEKLAAADPDNPDLQVALGHAYLQKLFGLGASPEVGAIAWKSDQAFDRALELDETNWSARFSKAVALSNWPAFLGRGSEAIEQFELLIEQQESQPSQPHFAYPYLFLGNMHQASGARPQAIATWKEGLARFPEDPGLLAALAAAGDSPQR